MKLSPGKEIYQCCCCFVYTMTWCANCCVNHGPSYNHCEWPAMQTWSFASLDAFFVNSTCHSDAQNLQLPAVSIISQSKVMSTAFLNCRTSRNETRQMKWHNNAVWSSELADLFHAQFIFICQWIQGTFHVETSPFLVFRSHRLQTSLPVFTLQNNRLGKHITTQHDTASHCNA